MRPTLGNRMIAVVVSAAVLLAVWGAGAGADELTEQQLQLTDTQTIDDRLQELTFTTPAVDGPTKVRVLLPDGYAADADRRYPVLYLLHGGFGGYLDWTTQGDAAATTAGAPLIVVMPDTGAGGGYVDWHNSGAGGPPMWESYHVGQLIPWIDDHYRTTGTRDGRAIAGLSMGGYGAMHYAARHPDLFTAAAAFSGAVDTNTIPVQLLNQANTFDENPQPFAVYGPRATEEVRWRGHNPWDLAVNLEGMFLQLDTGNGAPGGPGGDTGDPVETACWQMMTNFHDQLTALGYPHIWNDYGAGGHTWFYWQRDLRQLLPRLMDRFAQPAPPPSPFTHTSIDPTFSVWDWTVAIDRPELEFATLRDAGPEGFTLSGSGPATVTTASAYEPGSAYAVSVVDADGQRAIDAVADEDGRLTVEVSLGPANAEQQYSVQGTVWALTQGAAPRNWPTETATVSIEPSSTAVMSDAEAAEVAGEAMARSGSQSLPATGGTSQLPIAVPAVLVGALLLGLRAWARSMDAGGSDVDSGTGSDDVDTAE